MGIFFFFYKLNVPCNELCVSFIGLCVRSWSSNVQSKSMSDFYSKVYSYISEKSSACDSVAPPTEYERALSRNYYNRLVKTCYQFFVETLQKDKRGVGKFLIIFFESFSKEACNGGFTSSFLEFSQVVN